MWERLRLFYRKNRSRVFLYGIFIVLFFSWAGVKIFISPDQVNPKIHSYSQLVTDMKAGKISKLEWHPVSFTATVTEKDKKKEPYEVGIPAANGDEGLQLLLREARSSNHKVEVISTTASPEDPPLMRILSFVPTILIIALIVLVAKTMLPGGGRRIEPVTSSVTYDDVAGVDEAIEELQDVRNYLKNPKLYEKLGAKVPKGVLLYGPPGTGKTLLAKAVANETGCIFYESSGSEFIEMFAGLGARRVRQLFSQAKKNGPAIVFIDELDAIGGKRSQGGGDGATREGDQTLLQLLKEMDGFDRPGRSLGRNIISHPVIVIGATNRRETLDSALLRPGRFDRHIAIDPPDKNGRLSILKVHSKNKPLADDVDLEDMALHSAGFSGAELSLWLNEAALIAARRDDDEITASDVDNAYFRIVAGPRKQHRALSDEERARVSWHEAGHAIVGEELATTERVHKISIIPRGESGGQTISVSEEDVFLYSESALRDQIAMLLAGRAAEELVFNERTSGAGNDLERATRIAKQMVTQLGMSNKQGLRVDVDGHRPSARVEGEIDEEIKELLDSEYARAQNILIKKRASLDKVAQTLLKEETIDRPRFLELLI